MAPPRLSETMASPPATPLPALVYRPTQPPAMRYEAMCRAIAEAHRVEEVKDIRDKPLAVYAHQANYGEAERQCREIRLRAERRAGQLLADMNQRGECTAGSLLKRRPRWPNRKS
jgi:long-subunit acyl-CoA synthetase (AMP-forming)